ncbi:putative UPF0481 protein At3g02645 [Miscanthus floridulus]|uniref:putative UPF0481 protein At3g02645 n=1 Tax=Miscanthus floridulus TaxID=154761 RepID=UPI003457919B
MTLEALKERLHKTAERVQTRISMSPAMIHKFPRRLRGLGGEDNRYVVPGVVAIGPYHHGLPHLQEMEEVKHAVAYTMCRGSGRSVDDVYGKIVSIASDARRCYDADDAKVKGLSDAEFATMMFLDGCFLRWFMSSGDDDPLLKGCAISAGPSFLKDISMLENQIPWLVLEVLMEFWPVDMDSLVYLATRFLLCVKEKMVPSWIMRSQRFLHTFLEKCRHVVVPGQKTNTDGETRSITSHGRNFSVCQGDDR